MFIMPGLPAQVHAALTSPADQMEWLGGPAATAGGGLRVSLSHDGERVEIVLRPILGATEVQVEGGLDWAPRLQRLRRFLLRRQSPGLVLRVADLPRARAFYELLGWELVGPAGEQTVVMGTPGGTVVRLELSGGESVKSYSLLEPGLAEAKLRLEAAGHAIEREQVRTWGDRTLVLRDPDGHRLTLLEPKRLTDAEILAVYLEGGRRVAALGTLTDEQMNIARAEGKWTVRQLAHHLVTVEMLSLGQLTAGIAEPEKVFRRHLWQPDDYARGLDNAHRPIGTDLQLFDLTRRHVAGLLTHLPQAWDHVFLRDNASPTTVRNMVHQLATHTLHHLEQIPCQLQPGAVRLTGHPIAGG